MLPTTLHARAAHVLHQDYQGSCSLKPGTPTRDSALLAQQESQRLDSAAAGHRQLGRHSTQRKLEVVMALTDPKNNAAFGEWLHGRMSKL